MQDVRRPRLSARLQTDILHVDWGKAHEVACKIEHDIADEEIMGSIEKALGNPKTCPHGNPILAEEDEVSRRIGDSTESRLLADLNVSEKGRITRVTKEDAGTLQNLSNLGLVPGAHIEVEKKDLGEGSMTLRVDRSGVQTIDNKITSAILVGKEKRLKQEQPLKPRTEGKRKVAAPYADYEH